MASWKCGCRVVGSTGVAAHSAVITLRFWMAMRDRRRVLAMQAGIALVQSLGLPGWLELSFGDPALDLQAHSRAQEELAVLAIAGVQSP